MPYVEHSRHNRDDIGQVDRFRFLGFLVRAVQDARRSVAETRRD
jgi:hypothetical protein